MAAAAVKRGEHVLEIGPGTGNLTRHLLDTGAKVSWVQNVVRLVESLGLSP